MSSDRPAWKGSCPPLAVLEAFGLGRLSIEVFDMVALHTSSCAHCEAALERLEGVTDSLVMSLGHHLATGPAETGVPASPPRGTRFEGARLGHYELLELLGEGGMGAVYKATQDRPRRYVAVKVAHERRTLRGDVLDRLYTEVEAVGRLQHPNIVQIYESGEQDGRPYFAMEYVPGGSLAGMLQRAPLPERKAAELVRAIAGAVESVHRLGLIHRDLKPANVLIGEDGSPKLADFGLAKFLAAADVPIHETGDGVVLGTASYMAPEQARGDVGAVGPPVDVYGLGAILFESLTGRPPFRGVTREAILRAVESAPAPAPSSFVPVSRGLDAICLKCLEKTPPRRYASAQALADDLGRWLNGEAIVARPPPWWDRYRRLLLRGMMIATAAALILSSLASAIRRNPELQWKMIERQLDRSQAVNLLAPAGGTPYYRIRLGEDEAKVTVAPDGTLSVHSWSLCLIELVRSPRNRRYRFSVEVRHERSDLAGKVGVFFAHGNFIVGDPSRGSFGEMTYNDIHNSDDRAPNHIMAGLKAPAENRVRMAVRSRRPGPAGQTVTDGTIMASGAPFRARGVAGDAWRTLEIIVSPEGVRGLWDGRPVGALPAPALADNIKSLRTMYGDVSHTKRHPAPGIVEFDPSGGVGVLVWRGSASFRSARIVPLSDVR